jgi:mono/diheme cytochrome c family protein
MSWRKLHRWVLIGVLAACARSEGLDQRKLASLVTPAEFAWGEALYNASCAACHGVRAGGSGVGPPLVHDYYKPSHHGDAAFLLAAQRGVAAHHWRFGNMPPVRGVSDADVERITDYVRWLQREMGVH